MPRRTDLAFGHCFQNCAARFVQMSAVVEAAFAEKRPEVGERTFQLSLGEMMQSKLLEPWRIDQRPAARQRIQARERGRVPAAVQRFRYLARRYLGIWNQDVHNRRLAHAGLSEQQR